MREAPREASRAAKGGPEAAGRGERSRAGWTVDGKRPGRTERPRTAEDLARLLGEATAAGQAVMAIGGGRALGMGGALERWDLALETGALDRVIEYNPADLTVTVEAGLTLESLADTLQKAGQFLPLDPFGSPGHTIGGLLATGWSGPLRLGYRHPRDFLVGLRVALPDGRLARSGGRVVKNVSGYDLNKLHLGALGSTGVIVEASFKVFPRPLFETTIERRAESSAKIWAEAERALNMPLPPIALEVLSPALAGAEKSWRAVARLAGTRAAVERMRAELGWQVADPLFWAEHSRRSSGSWARLSVPRQRLQEVSAELPHGASWWASPGVGVAHWLDCRDSARLASARAACEEAEGSLVILAGPARLKRQEGAWGSPPPGLELMAKLKQAFDPGHLMAPGRYVV